MIKICKFCGLRSDVCCGIIEQTEFCNETFRNKIKNYEYKTERKKIKMDKIIMYVGALLASLVVCLMIMFPHITYDNYTSTIKKLDRECFSSDGGTKCKYMVYTDGEVLENTDSMMYLKFNSSDIQNNMEEGKRYKFEVYGWRIPFFSMYRNIIKASEIK